MVCYLIKELNTHQIIPLNPGGEICSDIRLHVVRASAPLASISFRGFARWHLSASRISVFLPCFLARTQRLRSRPRLVFQRVIKVTAAFPPETFRTFSKKKCTDNPLYPLVIF